MLLNFQALMALGLDGFANAAEALVGKAIGEKTKTPFIGNVETLVFWSLIVAGAYALIYTIVGKSMINLLTDISEIRAEAYRYLPWMILSSLIAVWCFMLDGVLSGATRAGKRNAEQHFENHGLWLAFFIFFITRGLTPTLASWKINRQEGFVSG